MGRSVGPVRACAPRFALVALTIVASVLVPCSRASAQQPDVPPGPPGITAAGAVVWDPADDLVLYNRAARQPRPPASTTKIMTVLLALEAGTVNDVATISPRAAAAGGASLGLRAGQRLPVRSLLAGLMLRSGNDAAIAVAEHVAGSESAFVDRMNARAVELDLRSTEFVNASGLTRDPRHVSSPLDLARLADVAMQHEEFARWAGASFLDVEGLPPMRSRNELLGSYRGATGVKTGYLSNAGSTLVASAERDGWTLYAVVLGSSRSFSDAASLLDHGFSAYRRVRPLVAGARSGVYRWGGAQVPVVAERDLAATVTTAASVHWRTTWNLARRAPLTQGTAVAEAHLLVDGVPVRSAPLVLAGAVQPRPAGSPARVVGSALHDMLRTAAHLHEIDRAIPRGSPGSH